MARVCDFPEFFLTDPARKCDKPVKTYAQISIGKRELSADYCAQHAEHVEEALVEHFGMRYTGARVGQKKRAVHISASGQPFSTSDVRRWLQETGHEEGTKVTGRLSQQLIAEYADAH